MDEQRQINRSFTSSDMNKILKLTQLWYEMVGMNHHKDRDCHWTITETWSYGDEPYYEVDHYGYGGDEVHEKFESIEDARIGLEKAIEEAFQKELIWANEVVSTEHDWDEQQIKQAKRIIEICDELKFRASESKAKRRKLLQLI